MSLTNYKVIFNVVGIIILLVGILMIPIGIFSYVCKCTDVNGFFLSSLTTIACGFTCFYTTRNNHNSIGKREGYLIVALAWTSVAFFSSLPYFLNDVCSSFTDAIFESVSGLTTTGATIFNDIEALPKGLLLWRSLTQWIGGMGIIVLTVAIFPLLGIGGVELFVAESPGPTSNKIHPRIKETAKRLWFLYLGLSFLLILILRLEGMGLFDAINHGLTTIATGGFSTKNASIAHFDSRIIQYTILFFMLLAGINYSLIYAGIKGRFSRIWASDEFKSYIFFILLSIILVTSIVHINVDQSLEKSFRESSFQIVSIITTTGFVSTDYTTWHPTLTLFFFSLLFAGACAGSTAGGIKFIRHLVFAKNSLLEFKRLLHPNALIRLRIDKQIVEPRILTHVLVFLLVYLFVFLVGTFIMTLILSSSSSPLLSAAGAVATSLGNVGPAIGDFGPMDNFASTPIAGKWFLSFIMFLGRLELFTILILFTPYFWRSN